MEKRIKKVTAALLPSSSSHAYLRQVDDEEHCLLFKVIFNLSLHWIPFPPSVDSVTICRQVEFCKKCIIDRMFLKPVCQTD